MARKLLGFAFFLCLIGGVALSVFSYQAYQAFDAPVILPKAQLFEIRRGESAQSIASRLHDLGWISHPEIFVYGGRLTEQIPHIKAGEYEISGTVSVRSLLDQFTDGKTYQRFVTIPEGLTSFEVVSLLQSHDQLAQAEIDPPPPEGSLLPETYSFARGDSAADIIIRMRTAMQQTIDDLWEGRADNLLLRNKEEALVLASIVEKETGIGGERAKIAGVFINRLRRGMKLQTDPTVIYALTKGQHENEGQGPIGRRLLRKDLEVDSPYNTYRYAGLPPTPIANPGRAAIMAVLHPAEHGYLYFVADGTGGHKFAKNLKQHNQNAAQWRKHRRQTGQ